MCFSFAARTMAAVVTSCVENSVVYQQAKSTEIKNYVLKKYEETFVCLITRAMDLQGFH